MISGSIEIIEPSFFKDVFSHSLWQTILLFAGYIMLNIPMFLWLELGAVPLKKWPRFHHRAVGVVSQRNWRLLP